MAINCPRCVKEVKMEIQMAIDGHSLRCRLCGYSVPIVPTVDEVIDILEASNDRRKDSEADDTGDP